MNSLEIRLAELFRILSQKRLPLINEKELQRSINVVLTESNKFTVSPEHSLDTTNIIDFLIDGDIGVEVKIRCNKRAIFSQCERYTKFDAVQALVLITGQVIGFPPSINEKPCYVLNLGKAWL